MSIVIENKEYNCDEEVVNYIRKILLKYNNQVDVLNRIIMECNFSISKINKKLNNKPENFKVNNGRIVGYLNDYQVCRLKAIRMKCKEILKIIEEGKLYE